MENDFVKYKPLYTAEDAQFQRSLPGKFPYTRGAYSDMYLGRAWTIRQYAGFSSAADSNAFYHRALQAGQRGLSIAFDLPTHRGYDSDHPRAAGDVGKAGVAIDSVEDMSVLLQGIPLEKVSVSMTMNGAVLPILACFLAVAERQGVANDKVSGTIQNDILKEYIVRNTFIYPPADSMRIATDVIAYISEHYPRFNSISVSGYHLQEAGAEPALELAFTLANALAYLESALQRGLSIDQVAPRLSFFFGMGMNFLQEVAKLRAARTLWAELLQEKFKPKDKRSCLLRVHCQTSGYSLTQQAPLNNIVRTTIEALAAVLGGTQSLHTNAYDEAVCLPTEEAARVARDTQLIIQHETDLLHTIDPLAGSYAIENLTEAIQTAVRSILAEIKAKGGMLSAIEQGYAKRMIEESAARKQALIDKGDISIIGVNKFRSDDESPIAYRDIDTSSLLEAQLHSLRKIKQTRDNDAVQHALTQLRAVAKDKQTNLMPAVIRAAGARATVGEISEALVAVFGRYQPDGRSGVSSTYLKTYGKDSKVQQVQKQIKMFLQRTGRRPRLLVAKLGQDGHDRGMQVIAVGFSDLGFDVDLCPLFQTPEEVAKCALENDVHVVGISSHTAAHKILLPQLVKILQQAGAKDMLVVVGGVVPPQDYDFLRQHGVDEIFATGTSIPDSATKVLQLLLQKNAK